MILISIDSDFISDNIEIQIQKNTILSFEICYNFLHKRFSLLNF